MYGLITSDGKPKTARSIHYTEDLFKKLRTPKRGRGAPRREQPITQESSEEKLKEKLLNKSMKALTTR